MDDWMVNKRVLTFKVDMGGTYIVIEKCEINYYMDYKNNLNYYLKTPYSVDVRELILPSWANFLKDRIKSFLENNPAKLEDSYNGKIIEVT